MKTNILTNNVKKIENWSKCHNVKIGIYFEIAGLTMSEQIITDKELIKLSKLQEQLKQLTDNKKSKEALDKIHEYCFSHYDFDDNILKSNPQLDIVFHLYDQKKLTLVQIEVIKILLTQKAETYLECGDNNQSEVCKKTADKLNNFIQSKNNQSSST